MLPSLHPKKIRPPEIAGEDCIPLGTLRCQTICPAMAPVGCAGGATVPVRWALPLNVGQFSAEALAPESASAAKISAVAIALVVGFMSDAPSVKRFFVIKHRTHEL
jgi:hypothetical protein